MKYIGCLMFFVSSIAWAQTAVVDVSLSPAGSFKITSQEIKGAVEAKDGNFIAKNITVGLTNIKTGIDLRDEHTKKYLNTKEFPEAILISAQGREGKGEGIIKIRGVERKIQGTYETTGNQLIAKFELNYQDFKIEKAKYMGVGVRDKILLTVTVPLKK